MRIILTILLLISSQSLRAAGIPVYVDRATMSEVQTGTNVSGRVVAGVIHTLSAEVAETVLTMNVLVGDSVKAGEELAASMTLKFAPSEEPKGTENLSHCSPRFVRKAKNSP